MAAKMKLKADPKVDGKLDNICISVVYDAIMTGGNGGKSGCDGGEFSFEIEGL